MRRIMGWIIGGLVTIALWVPSAGAQSFRQMPQNVQHNWRDIHQDRENLRHDRSRLQRDRADRWHDQAYWHAGRRAFWRDWYSVRHHHHHHYERW